MASQQRVSRLLALAESPMPSNTMLHATMIVDAYEKATSELVGKAVVLTDGKAGTVEKIWLDEFHGLRISINGHFGKWPVSTLKFVQGATQAC